MLPMFVARSASGEGGEVCYLQLPCYIFIILTTGKTLSENVMDGWINIVMINSDTFVFTHVYSAYN